ncbi:MAG: discoidin domain-containing protein [Bacteroidaceae bacterium]|nr:discoidin domain-containing protein [Bacteroidaceae bacterium]
MKKLYFLFALLLSMLGATTAFAQDDVVTIQVNKDNGQWTVCNSAKTWATQWRSYSTPTITITNVSSAGANNATTVRGTAVKGNNNMAYYNGSDVQFFTGQAGTVTPQTYQIEADFGWDITEISFDFVCSNENGVNVSLGEQDAVLSANTEDSQHITFNGKEGTVNMVVSTEASSNNFANTTNFTIVVKKQGEADAALSNLVALMTEYDNYTFEAGTAPGLYGVEEVAEFEAAKVAAHEADGNPEIEDLPDAERTDVYVALYKRLKAAYEAVLASKVPMTLTDGYYRIKSGLIFSKTETITDPDTMEEETKTTYYDKYMYTVIGSTINAKWGTPDEVTTNCPTLWYISNKDGYYDFRSVATDARFVAGTNPVTLSAESDALLALDAVTTNSEGVSYVNIRISTEEANVYNYLHCSGHSSGAGESGNIVKWENTYANGAAGASEWVFVPVSDEEANAAIEAYKDIKDRELMLFNYQTILADAQKKLEIAKDMSAVNLISENSQFSSPWTESSEGSLENLLDANTATYWHSAWSGGSVDNHTHYLQVALAEPIDEELYITIGRRTNASGTPVANDHVTQWGVFGSNNPDAADEEWSELGSLSTPYSSSVINGIKSETFAANGFQYLRFYIDGTTTGRGYGHVSEFQVSYDAPNENAQVRFMGDLASNLESIINELKDKELDDVTSEDYTKLKAAYDAFMAKFVDPTDLREVLARLKDAEKAVVVGTNPGFWADDSKATAFKNTYDEATAYDAKGDYTPEKSANYIETLESQNEAMMDDAIKMQTGKWYNIRFGTEEEFEKYGWDKVAGNAQTKTVDDQEIITSEDLFGKYLTVSYIEEGNDEGIYMVKPGVDREDLGLGSNLYFDDLEMDIDDKDLAQFRFISVGDTAYVMQNKGTNLFLKAAGTSGVVTLSVHPTLFNVSAIGYGENVIAAKNLTGDNQNYLHAQVSANTLVTWNANTPGSRSGLYLEEVENVASDYEGTEFQAPIVEGALNTFCFPIEVTPQEGQMWGVNSIDRATSTITLAKVEKAIAGRPFIYINGDAEDYEEEMEPDMVKFTHNYTIATKEPQTWGVLKGTFAATQIDRGDLYAEGNTFKVSKVSITDVMETPATIAANRAYIASDEKFSTTADVTIVYSNEPDGIQTALQNVSKSGAVYTIDGRLVSKKATLNDLQKFGKGLYILNGTKVIVK